MSAGGGDQGLVKLSSESPFQHEADAFLEAVDDTLAKMNLLVVAQGGDSPRAEELIKYDLEADLPMLDAQHRDHDRRVAERAKMQRQIEQNQRKAREFTLDDMTKIATLIFQSLEANAPLLRKSIREATDMWALHGLAGGRFDGPLAYKLLRARLKKAAGERTESDKKLYKMADALQLNHRLPDGCSGADYEKKAYAFIHKINPNLAQPYNTVDAANHVIELMPKGLNADGRRIKQEAMAGGYVHDLTRLASKCKEVVESEQKEASTAKPVLVAHEMGGVTHTDSQIERLSTLTGISLTTSASRGLGEFGAALGDKEIKWCENCPHRDGCFSNPSYDGEISASVWVNKEAMTKILARRKENSAKHGVQNKRFKNPSKAKIDAALAKKAERDEQRAKGRGGAKGAGLSTRRCSSRTARSLAR